MSKELVCGQDSWPLIPDAVYQAQCIKYDQGFVLGKSRKLFLHFKIIDPGEHFGKTIFMAFNVPYDMKIRQGSKYFKVWVMVNKWRKPTRNAKMSPRLFKNKIFKVQTRTVKPIYGTKEMPKEFWYSIVDLIIDVISQGGVSIPLTTQY